MIDFRVIPQSQLTEQAFDDFPVWSEYYDCEEMEDIVRWGQDRDDVLRRLRENERGNEHCCYTLLESNPFPPRMRIFIRAKVTLADGSSMKGYVMNEDSFCLAIFRVGKVFNFSRHPMMQSYNEQAERALQRAAGTSSPLFPVKFETEFNDSLGQRIAGEFRYGVEEA